MLTKRLSFAAQADGKEKQFGFDYSYWSHDGFIQPEHKDGFLYPEPGTKYADQNAVFKDLVSISDT